MFKTCAGVVIGSRDRLKICCPYGRAGSIPAPRTIVKDWLLRPVFYYGVACSCGGAFGIAQGHTERASPRPALLDPTIPVGHVRYLVKPVRYVLER